MKGWKRFMFVSLNRLNGLVIDLDSFPEDFNEPWNQIDSTVTILFISKSGKRLSAIKRIDPDFLIYNGTFSGFLIKRKSLIEVHLYLGMESYELAVLSRDLDVLKYIQGMNVSTIYFSKNYLSRYEEVGNLPDFLVNSITGINQVITGDLKGYYSEVVSTILNKSEDFNRGLVIVTYKEYEGRRSTIVSGGRYFSINDIRYPIHQLSQRIIKNKDYPKSQEKLFKTIYNNLIRFIEEHFEKVDILSRIPPRPSQKVDRLYECVNFICNQKSHIQNGAELLTCSKDYESQKYLNQEERISNIKGVFEANGNFEGKHVVILDDVMTTGSTALEAAKEYYEAGAMRVTILVLAINQFRNTLITSPHHLECQCGNDLKMRFNSRNNAAFFGCSNYRVCNSRPLNFLKGLEEYNHLNKVDLNEEEFDDTEWF